MMGGLGNFANLIKQASQMKENMASWQEELAKRTFEADAGAGMVRAIVNGKGELVDIRIEPQAAEDVEQLEELIKGAVGVATRKAHEAARAELAKMTGGIDIPGLQDMIGGGP